MSRLNRFAGLGEDLRRAAQNVWAAPRFVLLVALTLTLGVGVAAAAYSIFESATKSNAFVSSDIVNVYYSGRRQLHPFPSYELLRDNSAEVFQTVSASGSLFARLSSASSGANAVVEFISPEYLRIFTIPIQRGRGFTSPLKVRDDAAIVSSDLAEGLWPNSDPLGRSFNINGVPVTVIGVVSDEFKGIFAPSILKTHAWLPLSVAESVLGPTSSLSDASGPWLSVKAKLQSGVSLAQAAAFVGLLHPPSAVEDRSGRARMTLRRMRDVVIHETVEPLIAPVAAAVAAAISCVLLISCINLASLQFARNVSRMNELSIRLAIGASKSRLVTLMSSESIVASLAGAGLAIPAALWMSQAIRQALPRLVGFEIELDPASIGATAGIAVLVAGGSGLLFGIIPALRVSGWSPLPYLTGSGQVATLDRTTLRAASVLAQIALSSSLTMAAAGAYERWRQFQPADIDDAQDLVIISVFARVQAEDFDGIFDRFIASLKAFGETDGVVVVHNSPFDCRRKMIRIGDLRRSACVVRVGEDYFKVSGLELASGRVFTGGDQDSASVAVLSKEAARVLVESGGTLAGARIDVIAGTDITVVEHAGVEVVGVVDDLRARDGDNPTPIVYLPLDSKASSPQLSLFVKSRPHLGPAVIKATESLARSQWPTLEVLQLESLRTLLERDNWPRTTAVFVLGFLGFGALVLASVGVYGGVRTEIAGRQQEWGIRLALGANPHDLFLRIFRQAMSLILLGEVVGMVLLFAGYAIGVKFVPGLQVPSFAPLVASAGVLALVGAGVVSAAARGILLINPVELLRAR